MDQVRGDLLMAGAALEGEVGGERVQPARVGGRQAGGDRLAHQRVLERAAAGGQQPAVGEDVERLRGALGDHAGQRAEVGQEPRLRQHGCGAGDGLGVPAQRREPAADGVREVLGAQAGDERGLVAGAGEPLVGGGRGRAARPGTGCRRSPPAPRGEVGGRRGPERLGEQLGDSLVAQRRRAQDAGRGPGGQRAEQLGVAGGVVGSRGRGEEDRDAVQTPAEELQEAQRRAISPVQVVDHQGDRLALGGRDDEPVDAVQDHVGRVCGLDRRGVGGEDHLGAGRRAGEQPGALGLVGGGQDGVEQLADEAEGEVLFERRGGRPQDVQPRALGPLARLAQERGLPDARRSLEEDHGALAPRGLGRGGVERGDLLVALVDGRRRHRPGRVPARARGPGNVRGMDRLTRAALIAAGLLAVLAVPAAAQAAAIAVPQCARVLPGQQTIPISGTGFTPSSSVQVADAANQGNSLGSAATDAAGNFNDLFFGPAFPDADTHHFTLNVSGVDAQGVASPPVPLQVVRITATLPDRARPTSRVRYRVYGFETGRRVYLHIRRGGRTRGSFRISNANGPCGIASRRLRYMPLRRWSAGTYDYYFQHTSRFDRSKPGVRLQISIIRRIVG